MLNGVAIAADKPIAIIIKGQAKLSDSRNRLVMKRLRVEAEIHVIDVHLETVCLARILDHATTQAVGNINVVIQGKPRMIGPQL